MSTLFPGGGYMDFIFALAREPAKRVIKNKAIKMTTRLISRFKTISINPLWRY
jgi:hypothetical protein